MTKERESTSVPQGRYVVTVELDVKEEYTKQFRAAILVNAHISLTTEVGCLLFDVCGNENSTKIFLYEIYQDETAFKGHLKETHFLEFDSKSKDWITSKNVQTYQLMTDGQNGK